MYMHHVNTSSEYHPGYDDRFGHRARAAHADGVALGGRPGQPKSIGRQQISSKMREISDHQRGDDRIAQALPAQKGHAGKNRNEGVRDTAMAQHRRQRHGDQAQAASNPGAGMIDIGQQRADSR